MNIFKTFSGIHGHWSGIAVSSIYVHIQLAQLMSDGFQSDYANIHSHQKCIYVPIAPYPCLNIILFVSLINPVLNTNDVEHIFMILDLLCFLFLLSFYHWILSNLQKFFIYSDLLIFFLLICVTKKISVDDLSFQSFYSFLRRRNISLLTVQIYINLLKMAYNFEYYLGNSCLFWDHKSFPLYFKFLPFIFKNFINLELISI